uniref:uncharacterized protein LOC122589188 n=1 Tax=Erigeron canadensis TaxID=72917 RepID=UPI001CB9AEAB|nr:uncharacterized protein LOC122589188 [Erigeron canadensis]
MEPKIPKKSSKRFLFDKRYGYVYDEWRQPSEVALAYGRGMFCIVPIGKALFSMLSKSVNLAASRTIEALEQPERISPQSLQASFNDQLHQVKFSIKNSQSNIFSLNKISPPPAKMYE